jgi:hypothetical protein
MISRRSSTSPTSEDPGSRTDTAAHQHDRDPDRMTPRVAGPCRTDHDFNRRQTARPRTSGCLGRPKRLATDFFPSPSSSGRRSCFRSSTGTSIRHRPRLLRVGVDRLCGRVCRVDAQSRQRGGRSGRPSAERLIKSSNEKIKAVVDVVRKSESARKLERDETMEVRTEQAYRVDLIIAL